MLSFSMELLFFPSLMCLYLYFPLASCLTHTWTVCHNSERLSLLQFKESIQLGDGPSKLESWKLDTDCCSWDGIQCDNYTGHVIQLNLSSSLLQGSITSSSSLFHLHHIRRLSLSNNNFNHSPIPHGIKNLSRLRYLDLSSSSFAGQIPSEVLELPRLVSLDLSRNQLWLQSPSLGDLVMKGSNLRELVLDGVNISSPVPQAIAGLSNLMALSLDDCGLLGQFPAQIFQLTKLSYLFLNDNKFSGQIPSSIANLTELTALKLSGNNLQGDIPSSLGHVTKLFLLYLTENKFTGQFPPCLKNLTNLSRLSLDSNQLTGQLPTWTGNLSKLTILDVGQNKFSGPIPESIFNLANLEILFLNDNLFVGTVEFESFLKLKSVTQLQLNHLKLQCHQCPKVHNLGLGACNLQEFPNFLRQQDQLQILGLHGNHIHGQIPKWMLDVGKESLTALDLNNNFLTGFEQTPTALPWKNLRILNLHSNKLQSPIPRPPPSIFAYDLGNNSLTGDISPLICNLSSIEFLDMSSNKFRGEIPECLTQLSATLLTLSLKNNSFQGTIPEICTKGSPMKIIDMSQNQLKGQLPQSLAECRMLEALNLANNQINDKFPYWLGTIPGLRALILKHNKFHGAIQNIEGVKEFQSLRIADLSFNSFEGDLPSEQFKNWNAMKDADSAKLRYLKTLTTKQFSTTWDYYLYFSVSLTNKGKETDYAQVQDFLVVIDFSKNRFRGQIPEELWSLKSLISLDLSNNLLTGGISAVIANLSNLEALDLSWNELSGSIPPELEQLTFLEFLNLSENNLSGPIPGGKQLTTFQNDSYAGNVELCGTPLSKKCEQVEPPIEEEDGAYSEPVMEWEGVFVGLGIGLVIGIVLGHGFIKRRGTFFNCWI